MGLDMFLHNSYGNEIMYWRKANQIHNWFIENIGNKILDNDGTDFKVSINDLKKLLATITKVLENKALAEDELPTASGFFWGSQEYNEYYFNDLINTKRVIEIEIKLNKEIDYYYSSSC